MNLNTGLSEGSLDQVKHLKLQLVEKFKRKHILTLQIQSI